MQNSPKEVATRVRGMREILELEPAEMALRLHISVDEYCKYESNEISIPISKLYKMADIFGVDFTLLMTGEAPRMVDYSIVRAAQRIEVDRCPGYSFQSLAFNFKGRSMEPMVVELDEQSGKTPLVSHPGQEFNYVLEGTVRVTVGTHEFLLNRGDSCYFDPTIPHSEEAVGGSARFLTVIQQK